VRSDRIPSLLVADALAAIRTEYSAEREQKARAARLRNRAPSADAVTSLVHRPFQDLVAVPCVARHGPVVDLAATELDRAGRITPVLWQRG